MGRKDKQPVVESSSEEDDSFNEDEEVDIEEQVIQKIKNLATVQEKVQAIALNGYLIEKRRLDKELQNETSKIET
jgi:hypothetical protein